ncbi:MAG TPA: hypothetical protein VIH37_06185 [Candidatus Limnocylindrales bacterium]
MGARPRLRGLDGAFADPARPDVAAAFPGVSAMHGYAFTVPASPGAHHVCAFAINVPAGFKPQLGCQDVSE